MGGAKKDVVGLNKIKLPKKKKRATDLPGVGEVRFGK